MLLIIILIFRCITVWSPRNWKNINGKSLCRTNKGNKFSNAELCLQATKNILVPCPLLTFHCVCTCSNCFYLAQSTFLKLAGPQLVQVKISTLCFLHCLLLSIAQFDISVSTTKTFLCFVECRCSLAMELS